MSSACPTTTPVPRKTELSRSAKVKVHARVSDSGSSYGPTVRTSHAERLWLISLANLVYLFIWLSLFINNLLKYNLIFWKNFKYCKCWKWLRSKWSLFLKEEILIIFIYAVYNVNNFVDHYCRKITYNIQIKLSTNQSFF